jgi:raffinose/stachyose/melibiose transport system permease protein
MTGVSGRGVRQPVRQGAKGPRRRLNWALALFVLPGLVVYLAFLALPTLAAFALSLTDWSGVSYTFNFVGLDNYTRLATDDPIFRQTIGNNAKFTLTVLICQTGLSLLLALMLVKNTKPNIFYRALFFFPTIIASVSVALAWILMYDPNIGAINLFLRSVGLGDFTQSWLGNRDIAIFSLSFVQFWQHTGQVMIIFIAGLQAIPRDLYEAAKVEGASAWQTFRHVTWPLLAPAATIVVAYTTIQTFKAFDLVITLTDGGPSYATEILSIWIYHSAFRNFEFGYASAGSVVFMVVLAAVTWLQFRWLRVDR